jgi:hypothetical protein
MTMQKRGVIVSSTKRVVMKYLTLDNLLIAVTVMLLLMIVLPKLALFLLALKIECPWW